MAEAKGSEMAMHSAQLAALLWLQQDLPFGMTTQDMRKTIARHIERLHGVLDKIRQDENGPQDGAT